MIAGTICIISRFHQKHWQTTTTIDPDSFCHPYFSINRNVLSHIRDIVSAPNFFPSSFAQVIKTYVVI
jgi:hypothetical protein